MILGDNVGLFAKKDNKVRLVSYDNKVWLRKVNFKVTLQNTTGEAVKQRVVLHQTHKEPLGYKKSQHEVIADLKPLETKTFDFSLEYIFNIPETDTFSVTLRDGLFG